jgi:tRNA-Thr(GGU) m(6)t(6)A37 methyltransferase TsaA
MSESSFTLQTIGTIHSCFKEKFGVPRQPGLAPASRAELHLCSPFDRREALEGLQGSSHVWIQFIFHEFLGQNWKPTVRPPRLGGNKRMGVFATRSPVRPNPLGLSVVKLEGIDFSGASPVLQLSGIDLIEGTPVVDIKPYVPYVDAIEDARNDFADAVPELLPLVFSEEANLQCSQYENNNRTVIRELIVQVLQQDPRPSYQTIDSERIYGMNLLDINLQWRYLLDADDAPLIEVLALKRR